MTKVQARSGHVLLTREEFKRQAFARDRGRCVLCGKPAVDAHHILDRKLFSDGGYYLNNAASVCEDDHWGCEITKISVEKIRAACGITEPALPPGFSADRIYDKWGNQMVEHGLRLAGPLIHDDGARKALKAGGVFGLVVNEIAGSN